MTELTIISNREENTEVTEILKQAQNTIVGLQTVINKLRPKAEFAERVIADEKVNYTMSQAAALVTDGVLGRTHFMKWLRQVGFLLNAPGYQCMASRKAIDTRWAHIKEKECADETIRPVTLITGSGIYYLQKLWTEKRLIEAR